MASTRSAAITGMGAVTPIGVGLPAFAQGLRESRSGVRLLRFSDERIKSSVAAECADFDPAAVMAEAELARVPRLVPMALAAAREAVAQARLPVGHGADPEFSRTVGLILGTGAGGIDFTLNQAEAGHQGKRPSLWTITNATHGNLAGELSIALGLRGPSLCLSTGCASSSDAVGLALDQLRSERPGTPDTWIVVGADAHVRWETLWGMELLRVISTRDWRGEPARAHTASRPFDRTRDGFVLGEGAWAVVLERPGTARRREVRALGHVHGYGATCDAYHRVRPDPEMAESVRAMRLAVADAGLGMDDIEVVHYHGTSTQMNDAVETQAVKSAFGDHARRLAGHSVKGAIGHPQGASGLAAMVATLAGLCGADGGAPFVVPTINLEERDPECDLEYTANVSRETSARVALINCLAFGAKNSALVVGAG
ncbi:MAG TPA: beta-ketoacyl-[acyl-carrier-protein] synthase family protein [Phycisphaerales bacterium]|nr:beta-ketoacyl-[acyl-carrier-protein] synthase family protein [Phycisphaerales bacterium]